MPALMLIDGNSIINRAFYGQGRGGQLTAPDGTPTGAVYTFLNMFLRYFNEYEPSHICVAFDRPEPTFRHERYADYKKSRSGMPEDLALQMPLLKDCLSAMRIRCEELPGYEADDIIGTLAERFSEEMDVYILSGDRDDFQLLSEKVKQIYPKTRGETILYTPEVLEAEYGIRPDQVVDMKALVGDSSDDIPGIKGIGKKTALKLLNEYDTLSALLENADKVKGAAGKNLRAGVDDALLSQELAEIDRNVPLDVTADELKLEGWDKPRLLDEFNKLGFQSLVPRFGLDEMADEANEISYKTEIIRREEIDPEELASYDELFVKCCDEGGKQGLLLYPAKEEDDRKEIKKVYFFCPEEARELGLLLEKTAGKLRRVSFDAKLLYKTLDYYPEVPLQDIGIAAYLADFAGSGKTPEELYTLVFSKALVLAEAEEDKKSLASQLLMEAEIYYEVRKILAERHLEDLAESMEYPLAVVLAKMEQRGVKVEEETLRAMGDEFNKQADKLQEQIYAEAGHEFNINSPKQLGEVLFEEMGIAAGRKTPSGAYSTAASELERLAPFHAIVEDVLAYRKVSKLESTFVEGLIKEIADDGRIHTSFNQTQTATGRLSSADPNLQNIPMREAEGRQIRRAFVPEEGYVFLDADYSQIELRLLAALSEDENLTDAFRQKKDIHKRTAASIFGVPEEDVKPAQRAAAKTVNFSIIYGISDYGLSQDLKISRKEAHEYIAGYHRQYPAVKPYMERQIEFGREHGYVETYFGRRRYIKELSSKNYNVRSFGERAAMNAPVQGTAADIMKIAMLRADRALRAAGLDAHILLQVHDELLLEVKEEEASQAAEILQKAMEGAAELSVPLLAEVKQGRDWLAVQ